MFNSIHNLPFKVFRCIIIEGDISLLGEGTEQERAVAWEDILQEYADAIGETAADGYLATRRELLYFQTQKYLVHTLIDLLSKFYVEKWAKMLNKITRSNFKFNPEKRDEYYNFLERSLQRSKGSIDIQIGLAEEKLKEIEGKNQNKALKPTDEYFEKVLLNLHEFSNWQFDNNEITTFQYCELVKRYQQHLEYLQKQKEDAGRKRH